MQFQALDYLAWARTHQGQYAYDLSVSGMSPPAPEVFTPDPDCLSLQAVTPGMRLEVKQAVATAYGVQAHQVMLAAGTSEANFLVYGVLLSPGDAILVETPGYQPMARLASVYGARVLTFKRDPEQKFALDVQAIRRAWSPEVKLIALTNPHNPSGMTVPEATLLELGAWLESVDAYAVVDEVYRDFNPEAGPVAQILHPRLITTASLTKVYGLGSLRAGWALMPTALVDRAEQLFQFMAGNPATTMLRLAAQGLAAASRIRPLSQTRAAENRAVVADWLSRSQSFSGVLPAHGIIAALDWRPGDDDQTLVNYLGKEVGVLLAPGSFFGMPGQLRIAYGLPTARLKEALAHLENAAADYADVVK